MKPPFPSQVPRALFGAYAATVAAGLGVLYGVVFAPISGVVRGTVFAWPLYVVGQLVQTLVFMIFIAGFVAASDPDKAAAVFRAGPPAGDEDAAAKGGSQLDQASGLLEAYPRLAAFGEMALTKHTSAKSFLERKVAEIADVRFDLVIIDHGFHTHVSYETRLAWCKCWAAMGLCDEELLVEAAADFGLDGDDYKHVPMFLSLFPYPLWKEHRYGTLGEWLKLVKSKEWGIMGEVAEVLNRKMPREFHLMHRTSQQVGALFQIEYGMGWKSGLEFLRLMTKHALLGLRWRDRDAACLPSPDDLKTPDRAWFERESPAVDARMERDFVWGYPSGLKGQINESVLDLVMDEAGIAEKYDGPDAENVANRASAK